MSTGDGGVWCVGCRVQLLFDFTPHTHMELPGQRGDLFVLNGEEVSGWVHVTRVKVDPLPSESQSGGDGVTAKSTEKDEGFLPRWALMCVTPAAISPHKKEVSRAFHLFRK